MADEHDYYRVLGVARDASMPEIRRAYRRLARRHHPDQNPAADGPEHFRALAEAYEVLNDPGRRARYDHTIGSSARRAVTHPQPRPLARRGVLELSQREAQLAAATPLTLTGTDGLSIVLPAGVGDGDRVTFSVGGETAVLTIRVEFEAKDLLRGR
jgi:curved DNA-binding protein CbpA